MTQKQEYLLRVTTETAALIRGLHPEIKAIIKSALKAIISAPYSGKSLKDDLKGLRSYRVKRYRIIYKIFPKKNQIEVITIGPRKNIYEETFKLIRKEGGSLKSEIRNSDETNGGNCSGQVS